MAVVQRLIPTNPKQGKTVLLEPYAVAKIGLGRFKPDIENGQEEIEVFGSQDSKAY